jgi:hypothetical protein
MWHVAQVGTNMSHAAAGIWALERNALCSEAHVLERVALF